MRNLLPVGLVFVLCALALGGLWLHNRSLGLAEQVQSLEVRNRDLAQRACSLQAEVNRMAGYSRLDSLWVAAGRPGILDSRAAAEMTADNLQFAGPDPDSGLLAVSGRRSTSVPPGAN